MRRFQISVNQFAYSYNFSNYFHCFKYKFKILCYDMIKLVFIICVHNIKQQFSPQCLNKNKQQSTECFDRIRTELVISKRKAVFFIVFRIMLLQLFNSTKVYYGVLPSVHHCLRDSTCLYLSSPWNRSTVQRMRVYSLFLHH